jgi:enterochelin esterase-like enzyme
MRLAFGDGMSRIGFAWTIIAFFAWQAGFATAGEIRAGTIPSKALGREMPFIIYLPDGYQSGSKDYPVLYLLHGAGGDEHTWLDQGNIRKKADSLIASGAIQPAIIVMPGCKACWWVDGAKDKAESAFWSDLVPAIDLRYRTINTRGGRLVAGLSAGGYGAVRFGLRYPDRIAAVAALSPAVYAQGVPQISAARLQPPFLGPDGQFNQSEWDRQNYPSLLKNYFAQPARVPFYLVSGDNDKFGIAFETALLFKQIYERQPDQVELRVIDGDHSWKVWEAAIDDAMRYIFKFADKPRTIARSATAVGLTSGRP